MMRFWVIVAASLLAASSAFAACPTTSLTFKDAAGTTQTLCFGGASGAYIPQHQILDSGGTNALGINASGQITIANTAFTANAGTNLNTSALALDTSVNGLLLGQASTTSGQKGPILQGAVTTAAPSYTTAQTDPLSLTTAGALRTDASATTQPVSGTVTANQGGTWTVQPGNTQNTTPWLTLQQANNAGTATTLVNCNLSATYSASTSGLTQMVGLVASQKIYVCGYSIAVGTTATNVGFSYGTGTNCATGTTTLVPQYNLPAGANMVDHVQYWNGLTVASANELCINTSAGNPVQATVYYSQYAGGP